MHSVNISPEITGLIEEIKGNKTHGASQLARQAAWVLKAAAQQSHINSVEQFLAEQREIGKRLVSSRPAMAPIFNIVSSLLNYITARAEGIDLNSVRQLTISEVDEAINGSLQAVAQIARNGSQLIADGDRIMAHSYSSTVIEMLKLAATEHKDIEVIATRSGPGRTGETVARQLGLSGIPVTFIDDAAMGLYISAVNKVVVGADRVCADGKLVNGIGTYQLALVAERNGIPFYVLCETLKFDPRLESDEVVLEEKEPSEVVETGRLPPQVRVKNPYFDITPLELITGVVTENGLLAPGEVVTYMNRLKAASQDIPGLMFP